MPSSQCGAQWGTPGPAAAAEFLSGESLGQNDNHVAGQVAGEWVKTDPQAAIAWLDSIEGSTSLRANMIGTMVNYWTQTDPRAAAEYVVNLDAKERKSAVSSLMSGWAQNDFDSAQAFIDNLGDQELRNQATNALIASSAHNDPEKAAAAFATATAGLSDEEVEEHFGSAANNIANGWARMDPVSAATWAVDLPDAANRPKVLQNTINQWRQSDADAARAAVESADLNDELREKLLKSIGQAAPPKPPSVSPLLDPFDF